MIEKSLGIVLRQIKYGDTGLIAHLYTRRWGRIAVMVPGARSSSKSRNAYLFQPLTILDMDVYFKPAREMQNLREVKNHHPFMHISGDPVKSSVALFLGEVLNKALREEEPNEELFDFLDTHIQLLDVMDHGVSNFHLYFLLRLSRYLGFQPDMPSGEAEQWFDLAVGSFSDAPPLHGMYLGPDLTGLLGALLTVQVSGLGEITANRDQRVALLDGILRYYYHHLEGLGEIKSHKVLHALFD
jgi:DNA repair protein RecO (recombination protein O)